MMHDLRGSSSWQVQKYCEQAASCRVKVVVPAVSTLDATLPQQFMKTHERDASIQIWPRRRQATLMSPTESDYEIPAEYGRR